MSGGPFTDDFVRHMALTTQTQHGIIDAAKKMAVILAEMGRASHKAKGDDPAYAVSRWSELIRQEALRILREEKQQKKLEHGIINSRPNG